MSQEISQFPGGSKTRINRAGDNIRIGVATDDDMRVIEEWRAAHAGVLNTFQAILHGRARGKNITVAQRHKRRKTVFDKLLRQPKMNLSRMDDVAGCRLIFRSVAELYEFRENFHKAKFKHKRKNHSDRYDYIKKPKSSGYRGIHDIYEYDVNSEKGKRLAGLYVEIQYRTLVQHAWATANEVIGLITENQPKFQKGDCKILEAMALASEILSRAHESMTGCFAELEDRDLVREFLTLDKEIGLLNKLRSLHAEAEADTDKKNAILIFSDGQPLQYKAFREAPDALRELFRLENEHPNWDIVLVRADSSSDVRIAFKNYFSDARDFIQLIESGCTKLTKMKNISDVYKPRATKRKISKGPVAREWWRR